MYSLQHVFWRGAMALSLFAIGGIGAGVSDIPAPQDVQACIRSAEAPRREIHLIDGNAVARVEIARSVRDPDV